MINVFVTNILHITVGDSIQSMDINRDIQTRRVTDVDRNRCGTLIYHDDDDNENTPLIVGREQYTTPS